MAQSGAEWRRVAPSGAERRGACAYLLLAAAVDAVMLQCEALIADYRRPPHMVHVEVVVFHRLLPAAKLALRHRATAVLLVPTEAHEVVPRYEHPKHPDLATIVCMYTVLVMFRFRSG